MTWRRAITVGVVVAAVTLGLALSGCTGSDPASPANSSTSAEDNAAACAGGTVRGAGSAFPANPIHMWITEYQNRCGAAIINFQGGGPANAVAAFQHGDVDFAFSDSALDAAERSRADARCAGSNTAISVPLAFVPITVVYNIPNVPQGLNLRAATIARIFTGAINNWNDPAITTDNPDVDLPNLPIHPIHRSDSSGINSTFGNYLANNARPGFPFEPAKNWPAPGGRGGNDSQAIAQDVRDTPGAIGYIELAAAKNTGITYANIGNTADKFVPATHDNIENSVKQATIVGTGDNLEVQFDYTNTDPDAYPAVQTTYAIVCNRGNKTGPLPLLRNFLSYTASPDDQAPLRAMSDEPLPEQLDNKVTNIFKALN